MRRRFPRAIFLLLTTVFTSCAPMESVLLPDLNSWETRKAVLGDTNEWEFSGRIGVRAGDDGFNGKLWWRQDGIVYRARISGPIGIGTVFINGNGREVTLTDKEGVVTSLDDAERDLKSRYGWTIPVTSLRFWALGIPDPYAPAKVEFNAAGRMSTLSQREWDVTIGAYTSGGGQPMPSRLIAVSGDIRLRLVIDNWTFR